MNSSSLIHHHFVCNFPQLAQMEEDPEVDHVGTNPFEEDDMENELQNGDTMVKTKGFHDDSDDDMLL